MMTAPWRLLALLLIAATAACGTEPPNPTPKHPGEAPGAAQQEADAEPPPPSPAEVAAALAPAFAPGAATGAAAGVRPRSLDSIRWMVRAGELPPATQALRLSMHTFTEEADRVAASYLLGKLLTDAGDPAGLAVLERLPAPFEDFDDRRLVWLTRAYRLNGNPEDALATVETLLDEHRGFNEDTEMAIVRAQLLHELGRHDDAISQARRVAEGKNPEHLEAEALALLVEWTRESDPDAASNYTYRLFTRYPAELATREADLSISVEDLSDRDRYRRARRLMKTWEYVEAREELRRLMDDKDYGYEAKWHVAEITMDRLRDDIEGPRAIYKELSERKGRYREDALFQLMRSYLKEEKYDKGLEIGDRYLKKFPRGTYRERIHYYRGWLPYDHQKCEEALPGLEHYIKNFGARKSIVRGFYAWCFIRLERWEEAVDAFEELIHYGNPVVRGKAQYWQAYAYSKLGKTDEANTKLDRLHRNYPLTYYDILGHQLRATMEGRDPRASQMDWPEGGGDADRVHALRDEMWDWPELRGSNRRTFERVRRLVELGEVDIARDHYRSIRKGVERSIDGKERRLMFMRFMGFQVEDYMHGWRHVSGGKLAAMTDMPDATTARWLLAYPEAYKPLIERFSRQYDLPEHLVYAIMRQESRYRPRQISSADALGALQMIPKTAKKVAADMGVEFDPRTFFRPEIGFEYSFHYIRSHYDTWQQQLVPTAASYNGGPEPIGRWMRMFKGMPLPFLIEEFAYNESRIYCRKVAEHMLRYLYLYEEDPERRGRYLDELFPVEVDYDIPEDVGY